MTVKFAHRAKDLPLAFVPVLFGIQQLAEGFVWRSTGDPHQVTSSVWVSIYLFFALVLWPTYMPLATWLLETGKTRRKLILACGFLGFCVSIALAFSMFGHAVSASPQAHRIVYHFSPVSIGVNSSAYIVAACVPCLLSSLRSLNMLGLLALATAFIANEFYTQAFISVWCFLAATLSCAVLAHFVRESRDKMKCQQIGHSESQN